MRIQAAITAFVILFFFSCRNDVKEVQMINADKLSPDESMLGVTIVITDNGKHRAVLKTPILYRFGTMSPRTEFPKGLKVDFFTKTGERESYLESGYAIMDDKTRQFVLEDSVVMINFKRQDTLNTEYLVWKQDSAIITTNKLVRIHGVQGKMSGYHFRARENFTKYTWKKVKGEYFYNQTDSL
ncbi:MAG TPA: LPS export ABC transporter periplasmic protein LptC [Flavobacteriales bacterium]|nr:LPS export ABC transporter periplasmic protein LptC [Flavobacteriales bacterium]